MKAIFEYADGDQHNVTFPSRPRGLYKRNKDIRERPCCVTFSNKPIVCNREEKKWIWFCQQCVRPYKINDLSYSPVTQEKQESIVKLMTQKIDPAPQTDKHIFLDALGGVRGETQKAIAEVGLQWIATLLKKNNDYGSSVFKEPVLAPGMPVVSAIDVRMSDKIARIQNLKTAKQEVKDESIQDTYNDLGSYCLLRAVAQRFSLPHVLTGDDVGTHSAHCASVAVPITRPASAESITPVSAKTLSEINYELYRDALSKHFGKTVHSYTHWFDRIEIQFQSSFDQDLVFYYDKDHDQVAALPDIKLYLK